MTASPAEAPRSGTGSVACPFCASVDLVASLPRCADEHGDTFCLRRCGSCQAGFLWPLPIESQLDRAYSTSYYGGGETKFNPWVEKFRDACAGRRVRALTRNLAPNASVLDVGCGDGRLLSSIGRRGKFRLHGTELPGAAAERAARVPGIQLHQGTIETAAYPENSFDLITLVHVLEHLAQPRETLDRLVRLLRPGGLLFLSFPNIESWQARAFGAAWFHLDPPRHLTFPAPRWTAAHLQTHGLCLIKERHWSLEQNTYGWIQSGLNQIDRKKRNFLYERLKRNRTYAQERGALVLLAHAAAAALLLPPALLLDVVAATAHAGATVELLFRKE